MSPRIPPLGRKTLPLFLVYRWPRLPLAGMQRAGLGGGGEEGERKLTSPPSVEISDIDLVNPRPSFG